MGNYSSVRDAVMCYATTCMILCINIMMAMNIHSSDPQQKR